MGSDYKRAMPIQIFFNTNAILGPGVTRYFTCDGLIAGNTTCRYIITHQTILDRIYARVTGAPGAGETFVFTIWVNGVGSILTVTIAGAIQVDNFSLANAIVVQPGDVITMEVISSALTPNVNLTASAGGHY